MIACGEVDMLLFFRDPVGARADEPNAVTLLRLCDTPHDPGGDQHRHGRSADPTAWSAGDLAWIEVQRGRK